MDLSFSDLKDNKFKVAFIRIDIVTTYTVVIPIKSRSIEDVAMEITEVINKEGEEAMNGNMQIWKKHSIQALPETILKKTISNCL